MSEQDLVPTPAPSRPLAAPAVAATDGRAKPAADPGRKHPLFWVPSLYFAMGTPMITVSVVAAIMYKNLGVSNADIAFHTGLMYLPWTLKPLWAPVVEMFRTKKFFVITMELVMMATLAAVALALPLPSSMPLTLAAFWMTGFASATQDIAADGVYITSTTSKEQAAYVGVQGIFWNAGAIIASGILVRFTGYLHGTKGLDWTRSWMVVMGTLAGIMLLAAVWHARVLPSGGRSADAPKDAAAAAKTFLDAWKSFFQKKNIALMIAVVFCYRLGEGLIEKIGPLFLLDPRNIGGLGLDNVALGDINGTYGTIGFIVGALLGGLFAAKMTLRRAFVILALSLNVPHVTYFFLSQVQPESTALITAVVTIEKFGYGFGSVGHMLYMMQQVSPGPFQTAHYAFATGIMGLCRTVTGMVSGTIQESVGYKTFFVLALVASIPPIILAAFAPFPQKDDPNGTAAPAGH